MPIISKTIPNLVGIQMYYIPPEVVDPLATPIYQNWDSNIIIDEVGNRTQYDASTNPDNVLLYSWNMEYQEGLNPPELSYFYIKNEWTNNINIQHTNENGTVYYRILPDTEWSSWDINTNILLLSGQKCEIKRDSTNRFGLFKCNFSLSVGGNIMSLIYGDNYKDKTTIATLQMFLGLFEYATAIVDASNLILPATTLADFCYYFMFKGCTSLATAPELPATTLASNCYNSMFNGCTSLIEAPELPATTLASNCYGHMFLGCTSLTTAPELPATTLAYDCYDSMFLGCTSLTEAPELPATTLAYDCYDSMFSGCRLLTEAPELPATTLEYGCYGNMFLGCTSLTEAPELPATTLAVSCYYGMFLGCTSLTEAPELSATTLADACYNAMFLGCTSLTEASELPATKLAVSCYSGMFSGCTSLTEAPELPATTLEFDCYYSMFYNCTKLNYIKAMFTTTPSASYTDNWVSGVSSTGTFVKNASATWDVTGTNGIPSGWTVQTASS